MPDLPPPPAPAPSPVRLRSLLPALGDRRAVVAGAVVLVALSAVAAVLVVAPGPPPPELSLPRAEPGRSGASPEPETDVVAHAAGAVAHPGLYRLPPGSRVADLVAAAGGPTDDADVDALNLAAPVADGDRVHVPRKGESPQAEGGAAAAVGGNGVLDLNRASAAELEALPGIGPATAAAIVEHRTRHGRFRRVDDLLEVRGIGPAKLDQLRTRVRV